MVHAAGESSPGEIPEGTNAVVLSVPDEPSLLAIESKLRRAAVGHITIREPDAPWDGAATAIGLVPVADRSRVKRVLGGLPLLGKERVALAG